MPARLSPRRSASRARCQNTRNHAQRADALFPGAADASGGLSGAPGFSRTPWRRLDQTRQSHLQRPLHPNRVGADDHIKIVKNPKFHDAADVKLDAVIFYPTQDRSTAIKRFQAGELDSNDELPIEQLADLREKFGDQVHIAPYLGIYYCYINLEKEPWSNPQLRRAISMAIDREFLADKVWGGAMFPAYGFVPPGIEGYQPYRARLCRHAGD